MLTFLVFVIGVFFGWIGGWSAGWDARERIEPAIAKIIRGSHDPD